MSELIEAEIALVAGQLLLAAEELVAAQLRVTGSIDSYRVVPPAEVRPSAHRNVVRVAAALRGEQSLPGGVAEDERETGRRRALQGVPSSDVLAAYRRGIALLRDEFLRIARHNGISADAVLLGTRRIWQLGDHCSNDVLTGHREAESGLTRREEQQRTTLLARLLDGTMTTGQMVAAGVGFGLTAGESYWVLRARSAGTDPFELTRALERAAGAQATVLISPYGGDVAGVLSQPVTDEPAGDVMAGLAGPVELSRLSAGFAEATRLLEATARFGHRGIVDRGRIGLRLAVANEPELGEYLYAGYVEPVEVESAIGEALLASVETYLSRRRSMPEAAAELSVHVNTLRYRLDRFAALTGADLQDTETVFEVWWALQYRKLRGPPSDGA
ncbi:PucR family transcriptional regulator [Amycolatopsis sp. cmx-4-61]|uniref:PucR family transcriptional regulator n=1 Tax=Amycolatopsis sp. cmx-4-61 TaxID=2790937 RepID=UPI0039789C9D